MTVQTGHESSERKWPRGWKIILVFVGEFYYTTRNHSVAVDDSFIWGRSNKT